MAFGPDAPTPRAHELQNAHAVLKHTRSTVESFFEAFDERQGRRGRGAPTDHDYDLLRAMLVFACAGLDSMVKHTIRDALPAVIDRVDKAEDNFREFVEKKLPTEGRLAARMLSRILTARNPRGALVEELVRDLTGQSLQSKAQLLRAGSFFDLPSGELVDDMALFDDIFGARNQIVHEMDIDFSQLRRNRAPRPKQEMVDFTKEVLACAAKFLSGVDGKLAGL